MAKSVKTGNTKKVLNDTACKGTSIGRGAIKLSSMNKHARRSYKKYRGQGK
jgi:triosephosphate isomerase